MEQYPIFSTKNNTNDQVTAKLEDVILNLFRLTKDQSRDPAPVETVLKLSHAFLELNQVNRAISVLRNGVDRSPDSVLLWCTFFDLVLLFRHNQSTAAKYKFTNDQLFGLMNKALAATPQNTQSLPLHLKCFQFLVDVQRPFPVILAAYKKALALGILGNEVHNFRLRALEAVSQFDEANVREFYKSTFPYGAVNSAYFQKCIEWEGTTMKPRHDIIRNLYETAILQHGQNDSELWLSFIKWENSVDNFDRASALYWQAKKTLKSPEDFIVAHTQLTNSKYFESE